MKDVFTAVSVVVIIASLTWSLGVLIFGLVKRIIYKKKLKKAEKELTRDDVNKEGE